MLKLLLRVVGNFVCWNKFNAEVLLLDQIIFKALPPNTVSWCEHAALQNNEFFYLYKIYGAVFWVLSQRVLSLCVRWLMETQPEQRPWPYKKETEGSGRFGSFADEKSLFSHLELWEKNLFGLGLLYLNPLTSLWGWYWNYSIY